MSMMWTKISIITISLQLVIQVAKVCKQLKKKKQHFAFGHDSKSLLRSAASVCGVWLLWVYQRCDMAQLMKQKDTQGVFIRGKKVKIHQIFQLILELEGCQNWDETGSLRYAVWVFDTIGSWWLNEWLPNACWRPAKCREISGKYIPTTAPLQVGQWLQKPCADHLNHSAHTCSCQGSNKEMAQWLECLGIFCLANLRGISKILKQWRRSTSKCHKGWK